MADSSDQASSEDLVRLFREAQEASPDDRFPSLDDLGEIFPSWRIGRVIHQSRESLTIELHPRETAEPLAILTMRKGLGDHDWHGQKPQLHHANLAPILEWGAAGDCRYLIHEEVGGPTLAEVIDSGRFTKKALLRDVGPQIEDALQSARDSGIELDTRLETIHYDEIERRVILRPLMGDPTEPALYDWLKEHIRAGSKIGPFTLARRLGEGGFAEVYLADQREPIQRQVALKILKPGMDSEEVLARFKAERQALARLSHPHIATIHDAGSTTEGRPYFVMEYVAGEPLTTYAADQNLGLHEKLTLFLKVCGAIRHAHERGIVHRDLKPGNLLVATSETGEPIPRVIDFGIAKATQQPLTDQTLHTRFYHLIGSLSYMSPEQASMNQNVDERTDVYALGCVLYELLTERTPLGRKTSELAPIDALSLIRDDLPSPPSKAAPPGKRISKDLDAVVMKALEKNPDARYGSVESFSNDIANVLAGQAVSARPPGMSYRLRRLARNRRVRPLFFAGAGASLVALIFLLWPRRTADDFVAQSRARDGTLTPVTLIQFDGDLTDHSGKDLHMKAIGDPEIEFIETEIEGTPARVLRFSPFQPHQWLRIPNRIGPNGHSAATETNSYSIVMDVFYPKLPEEGQSAGLYQAHGGNHGSAELLWRWDGRLGKGGKFYELMTAGEWHRVALTLTGRDINQIGGLYVDGERSSPILTRGGGNGHFAANEAFLFFCDKNGTPVGGMVNSIAIYDVFLTDEEVRALGKVDSAGVPRSFKPKPAFTKDDESITIADAVILPPLSGSMSTGYNLALDGAHAQCLITTKADAANYGSAWVYQQDANKDWRLDGELPSPKGVVDNTGYGLRGAIWGDWAAVCTEGERDDERASISLFHRTGQGQWEFVKVLVIPEAGGKYLGMNLTLGDRYLIASEFRPGNLAELVRLQVWKRSGEDDWQWIGQAPQLFTKAFSMTTDAFERSPLGELLRSTESDLADLSPYGIIASHRCRFGNPSVANREWLATAKLADDRGVVEISHKPSNNVTSWEPRFRIRPANQSDQFYGATLALDDSILAVASVSEDTSEGYVDLFALESASSCEFRRRITYPWPGIPADVPTNVALDGDQLAIAAADGGGKVFLYDVEAILKQETATPTPVPVLIESLSVPDVVNGEFSKSIPMAWEGGIEAASAGHEALSLFYQDHYQTIDARSFAILDSGILGTDAWENVWNDGVEAAIGHWIYGTNYFFKDGRYMTQRKTLPRPLGISVIADASWKGVTNAALDAAFFHPNGHAYFLRDDRYLRFNERQATTDEFGTFGTLFPGVWPAGIDAAAAPTGDDRIFFFKGTQFRIFDVSEARVIHEGALVAP